MGGGRNKMGHRGEWNRNIQTHGGMEGSCVLRLLSTAVRRLVNKCRVTQQQGGRGLALTSSFLNCGGREFALCGMWKSPMTNTSCGEIKIWVWACSREEESLEKF